jgi:hypothetical protein
MLQRRVVGEVQHPVVLIVCHVEITIAGHRRPSGAIQAGSTAAYTMAGEVGLAIDSIGGGAACSEVQYPAVKVVCHIEAAIAIHRYPFGAEEAAGAHSAIVVGIASKRSALTIDDGGGGAGAVLAAVVGEV